MKYVTLLLISMSLLSPGKLWAVEDPTTSRANSSWEVVETSLETAELTEAPVEVQPAQALLADETIVTKKGRVYTLFGANITPETLLRFQTMTPKQQKNFQSIRTNLLKTIAVSLNSQALAIGTGIIVKSKLVGLFKKQVVDPNEPVTKRSLRDHGADSIQSILNSLNVKLWTEASKIGDAKEVSVLINPTGQVALGVSKYGIGGAVGPYFAFGYNNVSRTSFLDVGVTTERFKKGFVAYSGPKLRTSLHFDSEDFTGQSLRRQTGELSSPLVLPVWDGTGESHYTVGLSWGFSFPIFFTAPFYYTMKTMRLNLKRFTLKKFKAPDNVVEEFSAKAEVALRNYDVEDEMISRTCRDILN